MIRVLMLPIAGFPLVRRMSNTETAVRDLIGETSTLISLGSDALLFARAIGGEAEPFNPDATMLLRTVRADFASTVHGHALVVGKLPDGTHTDCPDSIIELAGGDKDDEDVTEALPVLMKYQRLIGHERVSNTALRALRRLSRALDKDSAVAPAAVARCVLFLLQPENAGEKLSEPFVAVGDDRSIGLEYHWPEGYLYATFSDAGDDLLWEPAGEDEAQ